MPKPIALPPLERLNELFEVVPIAESQFGIQSGLMCRIAQGNQKAGNVAGTPRRDRTGRIDWIVSVDSRRYLVSRIIYFMISGLDPGKFEIDHKDCNPLNNNLENLRLGHKSLQKHNRPRQANNTSGAVGVSRVKGRNKWRAYLTFETKPTHLGHFTCKIEAAKAYNDKVISQNLHKIGKPLNDIETLSCDCDKCNDEINLSGCEFHQRLHGL
jgi:hypothetical protein